jgi:hypothetical protein
MHPFRAARILSAALVVALLAACGETEPTPTAAQDIEVANVFATPAPDAALRTGRASFANAPAIQITKIRLTVYATSSGSVLFQQVFDVDPTAAKWTLKFTAPIGETIRIVAELISVTSGQEKVEYSGQAGPITVAPCPTTCTPIPIKTYPGPADNLGATSVTITPDGASVVEGSTTNLTATVAPSGTYQVNWSSLNTAVASVSSAGVVTAVSAGTAQIVAAVASRADTVTITVTPLNTCTETAYTIGSTANGSWTAGDCVAASGSGRHYDMYAVTLAQQTAFTVQLTGPAGRRINVRRAGTQDYVQVMASDAFMPPTSNPLQVGYVLPAGSYVMEVATPDAATLGAYSLATTTGLSSSCSVVNFVWPKVTINGSIGSTDCTSPDGVGREDRFIVLPNAGVRMAMSLAPTGFAPVLVFRDDRQGPASPTVAYDIQSEIGFPAKVAYTTTFAGFHEIVVSHANTGGTGNYSLTVDTESATNTCVPIATDLTRRLAVWEATDCAADGRIFDKYTFTVTEQTAFKVTLAGTASSKSAGVYRNGVEVLDWINSGTADLNAAWLLEPGNYEFRAAAPAASAGTSYTIVAADITDIGCTNNGTSGNVTIPGQTLGGSDCTYNSRYEDRLVLYVAAGKTIDVSMTASNFAPTAIIRDPATAPGTVLVLNTRADAGTITASYTATTTGYYQVIFSSNQQNATGSYSGSVMIR